MTQDEIIEMARDSGMELYGLGKDRARFVHHLVAFANLVAAKEREACAKVCEEEVQAAFPDQYRDGMTLRDYFAAKAMQGLLLDDNGDFSDHNWMAEQAYAFADAMLKAREV